MCTSAPALVAHVDMVKRDVSRDIEVHDLGLGMYGEYGQLKPEVSYRVPIHSCKYGCDKCQH